MEFEYNWQNNEANFGPPISKEMDGGTHITFDILLKKDDKYFALRRECIPGHEVPPESEGEKLLFLCHNLIHYGESVEECVKRIVKSQSGLEVVNCEIVDLRTVLMENSGGKKMKQWGIIPFIIAKVDAKPEPGIFGNEVSEVVTFTKDNIPSDFAFGKQKLLTQILNR
ncbi:MAG: hypothetical protein HYW27_00480 [Candidatus Aenigmarchaeota archaeon]|nr:hypothetical protein [Candidatus Aenigmarchaeota archaeon]